MSIFRLGTRRRIFCAVLTYSLPIAKPTLVHIGDVVPTSFKVLLYKPSFEMKDIPNVFISILPIENLITNANDF